WEQEHRKGMRKCRQHGSVSTVTDDKATTSKQEAVRHKSLDQDVLRLPTQSQRVHVQADRQHDVDGKLLKSEKNRSEVSDVFINDGAECHMDGAVVWQLSDRFENISFFAELNSARTQ